MPVVLVFDIMIAPPELLVRTPRPVMMAIPPLERPEFDTVIAPELVMGPWAMMPLPPVFDTMRFPTELLISGAVSTKIPMPAEFDTVIVPELVMVLVL